MLVEDWASMAARGQSWEAGSCGRGAGLLASKVPRATGWEGPEETGRKEAGMGP